MKKKIQGKTKKTSVVKKISTGSADEDNLKTVRDEPGTLISGTHSSPKKGKTKRRTGGKRQLLKSERNLAKLEQEIEKLKLDDVFYSSFISRMHQWLQENSTAVRQVCKIIDVEGDGFLSFNEFKAGMLDLNAPINAVELHLLCKLLDQDGSGDINYADLGKSLQYAREVRELNQQTVRDGQQLLITERKFPLCPCCQMSIVGPWRETVPKYILIEMRSVTFDKFRDYPGHVRLLVHTHMPVCGLVQMIKSETDISSTKMVVFRDKSRSVESLLPLDMTLEECGFPGDTRDNPEEIVLFYDFAVEFSDCPILLCDHYFGLKDKY